MKILDLQTGNIHEYGDNPHDSLYVSNDGRYLTYYNLQNGDGSGVGDYRFVCDDDKVPAESETADAIHAEVYFNIGGFDKHYKYARFTPIFFTKDQLQALLELLNAQEELSEALDDIKAQILDEL